MTARALLDLAVRYALAAAAGHLFSLLSLPLPWMIGPLILTAVVSLLGKPIRIPVRTRPVGQMIVSAHVGLYFTSDALRAILDHAPVILGVALSTAFMGFLVATILRRMTGADPATAFLSAMPGGPVEMGNLARQYGGDPGPVVFAQTLRISAIVVLVPAALYYLLGTSRGILPDAAQTHDPLGMALLAVGAVGTAVVFRFCRLNNPFFLGPLFFSCAATVLDAPLSPYPHVFVSVAQILLGTWLGATFQRELFRNAGKLVMATVLTSTLLVTLCTGVAASLALVTDFPWEILVLGAAPGSVTEMALTARFLHEDVALITAFHLVRIFLIVPNIPWMLALVHARATTRPPLEEEDGGIDQ
ncbi:MAG: AbrB family transcriptional regulator [Rhodospirillum sp.]|nr:AbrB family transcriptional regulator [Rhodospirillum sp.]MCF8488403.1 AbrB family transcriptional regulator [Rhodospirillum sp.]MCF8502974.1 AbrB family transcriptional regulator [Rhodospirillum sp.]